MLRIRNGWEPVSKNCIFMSDIDMLFHIHNMKHFMKPGAQDKLFLVCLRLLIYCIELNIEIYRRALGDIIK